MQRSWWAVACGLGLCPKPGGEVGRGGAAFVAVPSLPLQSQSGTSPRRTPHVDYHWNGAFSTLHHPHIARCAQLDCLSVEIQLRCAYGTATRCGWHTRCIPHLMTLPYPAHSCCALPASPPRAPPPQIDGRVDAASHPLPPHTYTHALLLPTDRLSIMHCIPSPSAPCLSASALPLPSCPTTGASFSGWLRTALPCASS